MKHRPVNIKDRCGIVFHEFKNALVRNKTAPFLKKYFFIFPEFPCGEGRCSFGMPPGHGQREKARRDIFIYIIFVLLQRFTD